MENSAAAVPDPPPDPPALPAPLPGAGRPRAGAPDPPPDPPALPALLEERAPEIRASYEGAVHALRAEDYADRLVHFSHSMREVIDLLARAGYGGTSKAARGKDNRLKGLCMAVDPAGRTARGSAVHARLEEAVDIYDELSGYAHHRTALAQDRAAEIAKTVEDLLLYVTRPQTGIIRDMNAITAAGPSQEGAAAIIDMMFRLSSGQYLLEDMPCAWLDYLDGARLFESLSEGARTGNTAGRWEDWSRTGYLSRCAPSMPDKVAEIVLRCGQVHCDTNPVVCRDYIRCALEMSGKNLEALARRAVDCRWHDLSACFAVSDDFARLIGRLYDEGLVAEAGELASGFLGSNMKRFGSQEDAALARILRNRIPAIASRHHRHLWRPLADAVRRAYENWEDSGRSVALAPHLAVESIGDAGSRSFPIPLCVMALRDCLVEIGHGDPDELARCIDDLLRPPPSIFARLALFLYGEFPGHLRDRALDALCAGFGDNETRHEYSLLLGRMFPGTGSAFGDRFFRTVDDKERQKLAKLADYPRDVIEQVVYRWIALNLHPIRDHLEGERMARYEDAVKKAGPPEQPTFPYRLSGMSPVPVTYDMFAAGRADGVLDRIAAHVPLDGMDPDADRTLRSFYEFVRTHSGECSGIASRAAALHPAAQYSFLSAMETAVGKREEIEWGPLLDMIRGMLRAGDSGARAPPPPFDPALEAVRVVKAGLEHHRIGYEARSAVWEIVEGIAGGGGRRPEPADCADGMDSLTASLNTVDGMSFHALCHYILWMRRHGARPDEPSLRAAAEIIDGYAGDRGAHTAVRHAALGLCLPMLFDLDGAWAGGVVRSLLSGRDAKRALWEAYVCNNAHESVMGALLPLCREFLVGGMSKHIKNTYAHARTVSHATIGYAYGVKGYGDLFWSYVGQAPPESVRQCGYDLTSIMKDSLDRPEIVSRVLKAWGRQEFIDHADFCTWFSACGAEGDAAARRGALRTLRACLERHVGTLGPTALPLDELCAQAGEHPDEVAGCVLALAERIDAEAGFVPNKMYETLEKLLRTGSAPAREASAKSVERLVGLGHNSFLDLLDRQGDAQG